MSVVSGQFRRVSVVVLLLLSLTSVIGVGASAQGNSEHAHRCQKGGWGNLAKAEDASTAFTNQGACVVYGAQGGDIVDVDLMLPLTTSTLYFDGGVWTHGRCSVDLMFGGLPDGFKSTTIHVEVLKDGAFYDSRDMFISPSSSVVVIGFVGVSKGATLTATGTYEYGGPQTLNAAPYTCTAP